MLASANKEIRYSTMITGEDPEPSPLKVMNKNMHPISSLENASAATPRMSVFAGKTMEDIDGTTVHLNQLARKVTLVVNVACFCTFTKQYPGLEALQVRHPTMMRYPRAHMPGSPRTRTRI